MVGSTVGAVCCRGQSIVALCVRNAIVVIGTVGRHRRCEGRGRGGYSVRGGEALRTAIVDDNVVRIRRKAVAVVEWLLRRLRAGGRRAPLLGR